MEYTIGSIWINNQNNEKIRIIDKKDAWGYVSYKVYGVDTDSIYYLSIDDIIEHKETDITEKDIRRWITAARVRHEFSQGRISKLSQNIIPLPHQVYVLNRVLERNKIRFILADEVGLGKTIEAGLVIKELKTRGLIKRTLVICPTGLVTQWRQEMIDKFDEDFKIVLPSEIDTIKNIIGEEDVYNQFSSIITPMDSIKPLQKRKYWSSEKIKEYNEQRFEAVINGNWDLIIIDEAHRVPYVIG
jgi:SNF2 family DNA or RNA helicase